MRRRRSDIGRQVDRSTNINHLATVRRRERGSLSKRFEAAEA